MTTAKIKLSATADVEEFVNAASKCEYDIDVFYNRFIIDAKSILGVLSMDLSRELTVKCYGDDPQFFSRIQKFAVA
ncbi:MAG TPA: HPr family phosphocarrier protein [Candidatus Blautia gallistercoris]|uniref:HPr family phosphocarrier protein n=1 Tax=Candidatus Blautia gallistercoris TaxID=2838490 RepID=A0A9D1WGI1_9FIRM|nr:HPr family phosphocarrier protein [Candidatus Blautia gallistercoris]